MEGESAADTEIRADRPAKPVGRPRQGGNGRQAQKHIRASFSVRYKVDVLAFFDKSADITTTINHFYPSLAPEKVDSRRTLIYSWRSERAKLEQLASKHSTAIKKKSRTLGAATVLGADAEKEVVVWVNDLRSEGVPVSTMMLKLKALSVARSHGVRNFYAS